tara:strand:- start:60 stop:1136 length:1077 start_codon:yes stop_codon:yes gene_type:complete
MSKLFKIIISGPNCSGKTTLLHLLDGETNLVNFYHDKILNLFKEFFLSKKFYYHEKDLKFDKKIVKVKSNLLKKIIYINIPMFKSKLYNVGYASLEDGVFYNEAPAHYSIKSFHEIKKHEINFNFQNFDDTFKKLVFKNSSRFFFYEQIIDFYCYSFQKNIKKINDKKFSNIIFKSPNELQSIKDNLQELKSAKFIYVKRDLLGLIKSRAMDKYIRDKHIKKKDYQRYFRSILFSKYIENIKKNYLEINLLKKKYSKKLFVTSIEKIIYDKKNEMDKILNFLNIEKKNIFFKATFNGLKVSENHTSNINDDKILISKYSMDLYNLRINGFKFYLQNFSKISVINLIFFLYIKLKNFII